ncbi:hypothetical protein MAR621_02103 [Maribacter dokdonensis]|nr:hypothetical protein MAR621_02103 [Maribacter dokdonensis]
MNKGDLKIITLYIVSIVCIACYFLMENFNFIFVLVEKSSPIIYDEFVTLILAGLFQYGLLVIGMCIFIVLSFLLIREKISKAKNN